MHTLKTRLDQLRQHRPLVLNLTNIVTMDLMANALLALGAAPLMSVEAEEIEELTTHAAAVNINIGTLDHTSIQRFQMAAEYAHQQKKPLILDPVGCGASQLRTQTSSQLLPYATVVKGNASEIIALAGNEQRTHGVDTVHSTEQAKSSAQFIANQHRCIVVISGASDFITDGKEHVEITFGAPLMTYVTGMGCTLGAIIAAFCHDQNATTLDATAAAVRYFSLCGMHAARTAPSPGQFRSAFIDALYEANLNTN